MVTHLVVQNLFTIRIHSRDYLCLHIDLRIISDQFILFFLLDDLFFDLGQLCFLTGSLLHNFQRNKVFICFQSSQFCTSDIIININLVRRFVGNFNIGQLKFIFIIQHIYGIREFHLTIFKVARFIGGNFQSDRRQSLKTDIQHIIRSIITIYKRIIHRNTVTRQCRSNFLSKQLLLFDTGFIVYTNRIIFHRFSLHHLHPFVHLGIHFPTHNLTIERVQSVCIPEDHLFRTIGQQKYLAVLVVLKETPTGNTACRINDILFHNTILQVDDLYILSIFHHTDIFSFRME